MTETRQAGPVQQAMRRVLVRVAEQSEAPRTWGFGRMADAIELGDPQLSRDAALVDMAAWCIEQLAEHRQQVAS